MIAWDPKANQHNLLGLPSHIKRPFIWICFQGLSRLQSKEDPETVKAQVIKETNGLIAKHVDLGDLPAGAYCAVEGEALDNVQIRHPDLAVVTKWYQTAREDE